MTTLKDVAKAVGCDVSTVSRVLNGRPNRVSGENRSRIREAALRLGYVANRTASSLASGVTRTVGLLIPNVFDGVYAEYIETLDLELSAAGYALRPFICHNRPEKENTALDALLHHEVDAMIAMYHNAERCAAQYEVIRRNGLPLIFRSNVPEVDGVFDCVLLDIDAGYRALAEHLIERGCRKIGVVGGCADALQEGRAGAGADFFRAALQKAGLAADSRNAVACEDSQEAAYRAVLERLKKELDAFDGLIVHNINKVFGCCRAVGDAGLSIPGQVKVATISDLALCRLYSVPLTVWAQPVPEICRALVDLTLARLREPDAPCRTVKFHSTLLARESTQPTHERK